MALLKCHDVGRQIRGVEAVVNGTNPNQAEGFARSAAKAVPRMPMKDVVLDLDPSLERRTGSRYGSLF